MGGQAVQSAVNDLIRGSEDQFSSGGKNSLTISECRTKILESSFKRVVGKNTKTRKSLRLEISTPKGLSGEYKCE